ncbi:MAG TPA: hypothetical protein VF139_12165 [Candidatus Polarisedimenticolaceae bacterium]
MDLVETLYPAAVGIGVGYVLIWIRRRGDRGKRLADALGVTMIVAAALTLAIRGPRFTGWVLLATGVAMVVAAVLHRLGRRAARNGNVQNTLGAALTGLLIGCFATVVHASPGRTWTASDGCPQVPCPLRIRSLALTGSEGTEGIAVVFDSGKEGAWDASKVAPGTYSVRPTLVDKQGNERNGAAFRITVGESESLRRFLVADPGREPVVVESCNTEEGIRARIDATRRLVLVNGSGTSLRRSDETEAIDLRRAGDRSGEVFLSLPWPGADEWVAGEERSVELPRDYCDRICSTLGCDVDIDVYGFAQSGSPSECVDRRLAEVETNPALCAGAAVDGCASFDDADVERTYAAIRRAVVTASEKLRRGDRYPDSGGRLVPFERIATAVDPASKDAVGPILDGWGRSVLYFSDGLGVVLVSPGCDGELERDYTPLLPTSRERWGSATKEICLGEGDLASDVVSYDREVCRWPTGGRK